MENPPPRPGATARRAPTRRWRRAFVAASLGLVCAIGSGLGHALEPLAPPTGEVLLVITGDIAMPNVGDEAHLDRAHLHALPRARFTTDTPWSKDGPHEYEGVRLDALLEAVGANGTRFFAQALDDYDILFEGVDLAGYPIIVADTRDGTPLTVRRLGPLRILFPFDDHPELLTRSNTALSVWQLIAMDVR